MRHKAVASILYKIPKHKSHTYHIILLALNTSCMGHKPHGRVCKLHTYIWICLSVPGSCVVPSMQFLLPSRKTAQCCSQAVVIGNLCKWTWRCTLQNMKVLLWASLILIDAVTTDFEWGWTDSILSLARLCTLCNTYCLPQAKHVV